jgi:GntR family transcriptional regulator / MocR family aminotransferase
VPALALGITSRFGDISRCSLDYAEAQGLLPARSSLAAYLNRSRATATDADRVLLCTGFAQGMRLVCETLRARGVRRIAVEDPGTRTRAAMCGPLDLS